MRVSSLWCVVAAVGLAACGGGGGDDAPAPNPTPSLTSVAPAAVSAGGPAFTLTVNGTNFTSGAVVLWNGSNRATTFLSASQLTAAITATDITAPGNVIVTANNPAPGGGTSNSMPLTIGNAAPTVSALVPNTSTAPGSSFVLTVNGTGFVDGAVIKWNGGERTTTFVTSGALQAVIAASDVALAADVPVTVTNPGVGGGTSSPSSFTVTNPAPSITSRSPTLVVPGSAAFDLTVNGTGFVSTSVVQWNGADRPTTFASASQLTVAIPASDIVNQSVAAVTVVNRAPGGGSSNPVDVFVGNPIPAISTLVPAVVRPGSNGATLRVLGSFFINSSVVRLDGVDLPTTFVSSSEVRGTLSAPQLATQQTPQVTVANPGPGGGLSNVAILNVAPYGAIEKISLANDGSDANGASDQPSSSDDGRFVAFASLATNLVSGDTNGVKDVFVRDTCLGASGCTPSTVRISVADDGSQASAASDKPSISANGRFVAFASVAANLVAGDSNGVQDVFLRDTCLGVAPGCVPSTTRISVASDGTQGNLESASPSIGANGRYIAFTTASILVLGDVNGVRDAFVRDTCVGALAGCVPVTTRIFVDPQPLGNLGVTAVVIGSDGRFVALENDSNLGGSPTNGVVFVFDTCAGAAAGCSPSSMVAQQFSSRGSFRLFDRALSTDGRFVVAVRQWRDVENQDEVWLSDTCIGAPAGCTPSSKRVPPLLAGSQNLITSEFSSASLTPDGRFVSYTTVTNSQNYAAAVFDTCRSAPDGCLPGAVRISEASDGTPPDGHSIGASLDASGGLGAFTSDASNLVPGDSGLRDVFRARTGFILR